VTDEELTTNEPETEVSAPASEPVPAPEPEPAPAPEPEEPAAPVEVITVGELLDRLTGGPQESGEMEEPAPEEETTPPSEDSGLPIEEGLTGPIEVVGMDTALKRLQTIQATVDHPMLTTPFEDYTVTEGLLLLLFLSVVAAACVKMLKGGFAWLR